MTLKELVEHYQVGMLNPISFWPLFFELVNINNVDIIDECDDATVEIIKRGLEHKYKCRRMEYGKDLVSRYLGRK